MASLGPPHTPETGLPAESADELRQRAGTVWKRVVSLIGYFDLDPNRALDIILDIFSSNILAHHTFFIALLSLSPWAPEEFDVAVDTPSEEAKGTAYTGKSLDDILRIAEDLSWEGVKKQPPPMKDESGRVMAQILGFKFAHYQVRSSDKGRWSLF